MTKSELIEKISESLKLPAGKAEAIVNCVFDSMVKAIHGLIDHSANTDQRIEWIVAELKRLGGQPETPKPDDHFDAASLNKLVD